MSIACTREACLARPIDEVDGACAASPGLSGVSFPDVFTGARRIHWRCRGSAAHPPDPPFTRGKGGRRCQEAIHESQVLFCVIFLRLCGFT